MTTPTRLATAAAMLGAGWWISDAVRGLGRFAYDDASRLGLEMLGIEVGLVALAVSLAWALPGSVTDRLGLRAGSLSLGVVVALVIGTLGLSHAINGMLQLTQAAEGSVMVGISRGTRQAIGWGFVLAFVGTALAPALGEELLCRGLLQRTLARWSGAAVAIAVSSVFFGWLHMELLHGLVAGTIGIYLGLMTHWSGSVRPAIAAHAANNGFALLASKGLLVVRLPILLSIVCGLALALGALLWAVRQHRRASPPAPPGEAPVPARLQPDLESTDF